jgi:hypothetical protein
MRLKQFNFGATGGQLMRLVGTNNGSNAEIHANCRSVEKKLDCFLIRHLPVE